jgi:hypothetical protein
MKKVCLLALALLISVAFVSQGIAQDKAKAPEKPAAAPEKAAAAAPEKPAAVDKDKAAAPEKAAKPKAKPRAGFAGEVTAFDAAAKIVTVKGKKETIGFDVTNAKLKGYKSADEIKVGDKVLVAYAKDGIKIAKLGGKKAEKAAKVAKAVKAKKAAFKDVDKNSDGKITVEELVIVFVNVTPEQFKALDKNNDGALDESEYKALK